eukprot:scaffold70215_cov65-Phaeocystis_antarctica.AAC.5
MRGVARPARAHHQVCARGTHQGGVLPCAAAAWTLGAHCQVARSTYLPIGAEYLLRARSDLSSSYSLARSALALMLYSRCGLGCAGGGAATGARSSSASSSERRPFAPSGASAAVRGAGRRSSACGVSPSPRLTVRSAAGAAAGRAAGLGGGAAARWAARMESVAEKEVSARSCCSKATSLEERLPRPSVPRPSVAAAPALASLGVAVRGAALAAAGWYTRGVALLSSPPSSPPLPPPPPPPVPPPPRASPGDGAPSRS